MYKKPSKFIYHIFSNGYDEWESDEEIVFEMLENMLKEGLEDIRIYKSSEWNKDDGIFEDGDCIFSLGQWPN